MTYEDRIRAWLTQEQFCAWLQKQSPDTPVGEVARAHSCPISRYIVSKHNKLSERVATLGDYVGIDMFDRKERRVETPYWVRLFVKRCDAQGGDVIRAKRALEIMQEIQQQEQHV